MKSMNVEEKIAYMRREPIFWSRLGWGSNPSIVKDGKVFLFEEPSAYAKRHKEFYNRGILLHSSILPLGWIGVDKYDYQTVDEILDAFFKECPNAYYLPRIKLDVPVEWCKKYPEDVMVYHNGPKTREGILALVDTEKQDMLGFNSQGGEYFINGKWEKRANIDGVIALQSFSSKQWLQDAGEALRRLIEHIENSKYKEQIFGYHIAYGCCGETTVWGTWERNLERRGDYGIRAVENFTAYAKARGKEYTYPPEPAKRYELEEVTLDNLFYHTKEDEQNEMYARFVNQTNVEAISHFCRIVKENTKDKVAGIFYGYIVEVSNCCDGGHLAYNEVLSCPYVDFVCGPKGYCRVDPYGPSLGEAIANSINRKKLWVDEIDNRTHLAKNDPSAAKDFEQTKSVYWRECAKNLMAEQGYWWMELGKDWLNDKQIQDEIGEIRERALDVSKKKHKDITEILLVMNEEDMYNMRVVGALYATFFQKFGATVKDCGAPVTFVRLKDLEEMKLSQYKVIFFMNAFCIDGKKMEDILRKTNPHCHLVWNYTPGILTDGKFGLQNVKALTGFTLAELSKDEEVEGHKNCPFPLVKVLEDKNVEIIREYSCGGGCIAKRRDFSGRTHILQALPTDITAEDIRKILEMAEVHLYAPIYCNVHADNRFIYFMAEKDMAFTAKLTQKSNCLNVFTGELLQGVEEIPLSLSAGYGVFFQYV